MSTKSKLGKKFLQYWKVDSVKDIQQEQIPVLFLKLKVNSLTEVDVAASTFKADFTVMVDWHDPSICLAANPFVPEDHFYPVVLIDNLADELEEEYNVEIRHDNKSGVNGYVKFTKRYIKTLTTPISCEEFPFDKQALQFEFKAQGVEDNSKVFVQFRDTFLNCRAKKAELKDAVRLRDKFETFQLRSPRRDYYHSTVHGADRLAEWQFHSLVGFPDIVVHDANMKAEEPAFSTDFEEYGDGRPVPEATFDPEDDVESECGDDADPGSPEGDNVEITEKYIVQLRVARDPRAGFMNVLFPITLTGVMSFATYAIGLDSFGDRCGAILTLLLTLVAFKFSLENKIPQVPYLTTLDVYLLATMIMFTIQLIGQAISSGALVNEYHESAVLVDYIVGGITGVFWFGLQTYVVRKMVLAQHSLPNQDDYFITPRRRLYKSLNPYDFSVADKEKARTRMYSPALKRARNDIATQELHTKKALEARHKQLAEATAAGRLKSFRARQASSRGKAATAKDTRACEVAEHKQDDILESKEADSATVRGDESANMQFV